MKTTAKKMSVFQLTSIVAANMLGAGIIMLPSQLAQADPFPMAFTKRGLQWNAAWYAA